MSPQFYIHIEVKMKHHHSCTFLQVPHSQQSLRSYQHNCKNIHNFATYKHDQYKLLVPDVLRHFRKLK